MEQIAAAALYRDMDMQFWLEQGVAELKELLAAPLPAQRQGR